jgi:phosphoribosylglycinamide formyltransferase 2
LTPMPGRRPCRWRMGLRLLTCWTENPSTGLLPSTNPILLCLKLKRFYEYEKKGLEVIPSARAANFTMNRKAIRDLAAKELGLKTARYQYATTLEQFSKAVEEIGIPCVVKPLMSSSGKGQSVVKTKSDVEKSWDYAIAGSRGDLKEVIIEEFIPFESEITLLTVTQKKGPTLFCPPIGHRQERGDYQESWQPHSMDDTMYREACSMAEKVTRALGGSGIWGVEFFLTKDQVYFSELSPRPHDTGMVTLAGTQNFSEFELHARAILGLPIPEITLERNGVSAVILSELEKGIPEYSGLEEIAAHPKSDFRIFGKPELRKYRRMGVVVCWDIPGSSTDELRKKAKSLASKVTIGAQNQDPVIASK